MTDATGDPIMHGDATTPTRGGEQLPSARAVAEEIIPNLALAAYPDVAPQMRAVRDAIEAAIEARDRLSSQRGAAEERGRIVGWLRGWREEDPPEDMSIKAWQVIGALREDLADALAPPQPAPASTGEGGE